MNKIKAVYDDDLINFLKSVGVLSEIEQGKSVCRMCNKLITLDNLLAVFPLKNKVNFCCDNEECLVLMNKEEG